MRTRYGVGLPKPLLPMLAVGVLSLTLVRDPKREALLPSVAVLSVGFISAMIDSLTMKLPFRLTRLLLIEVTVLGLAESGGAGCIDAMAGGLLWANVMLFGHAAARAVGYGDVLFGLALGFWLGLSGFGLSVLGLGLVAPLLLVKLILTRGSARSRFAFGPYLFAAASLAWAGVHA